MTTSAVTRTWRLRTFMASTAVVMLASAPSADAFVQSANITPGDPAIFSAIFTVTAGVDPIAGNISAVVDFERDCVGPNGKAVPGQRTSGVAQLGAVSYRELTSGEFSAGVGPLPIDGAWSFSSTVACPGGLEPRFAFSNPRLALSPA